MEEIRPKRPLNVLVTGTGAPPGLAALRALRGRPEIGTLVAADANPYAGGLFEPGVAGVAVPPANLGAEYVQALTGLCSVHNLDVILPCSEAELLVLAHNRTGMEQETGVKIPIARAGVCARGVDKWLTVQAVQKAKGPVPRTLAVDFQGDPASLEMELPVVVKPRAAQGAKGLTIVEDRDRLAQVVDNTVRLHGPCLVQEFIPGGSNRVYTIGALYDQGRLRGCSLHRKLATNPPSGGVAVAGVTEFDQEVKQAGLAVLEATGPWHGLTAVEMKVSAADGKPYLMEINPRFWGFGFLAIKAGINFPLLAVLLAVGLLPPEKTWFDYKRLAMIRTWDDVLVEPDDLPEGFDQF